MKKLLAALFLPSLIYSSIASANTEAMDPNKIVCKEIGSVNYYIVIVPQDGSIISYSNRFASQGKPINKRSFQLIGVESKSEKFVTNGSINVTKYKMQIVETGEIWTLKKYGKSNDYGLKIPSSGDDLICKGQQN